MDELMAMFQAVIDACDTYKIVEVWDGEPGIFENLSFRVPKDSSKENIIALLLDYIENDRDLTFFENPALVKATYSESGDITLSDPDGVFYIFRKI